MKSKIIFGIAAMVLFASCDESFEMVTESGTGTPSEVFNATTESEPPTRT